jgi:putative phosphoribosyl transferase
MKQFDDRGGHLSAQWSVKRLEPLRGQDIMVLGLGAGNLRDRPGSETSLGVLVLRKPGVPFQPELAFSAIGEGPLFHHGRIVFRIAGKESE